MRHVEIASTRAPLTPGPAEQVVGRPTGRLGAPEIVTGARRYPTDLSLPGMLHGRSLRPPAFGATLRSVDVTRAKALPGVTVVQEDSFVGVAAPDPFRAARAMQAIEADWDLAPQPSETELGDHLRSHPVEEHGWEGAFHKETGDVDGALASAPVRLAASYATAYVAHVPLETHVALAEWKGSRLTVWSGTQQPFGVRGELAEALGVPEADVRVIVPDTGGGFGGKHGGEVAADAARLSRAIGRPVKVRWSREDEFVRGYLRPAAVIDVRSGARADGAITGWELRNTNSGMFGVVGPYEIPNQRLDYQPADSPLPQGSYRALAATANHFARESHMDELAHALGIDPLGLRLNHLRDDRLAKVFRAAAERMGWNSRPREPGLGMGIAGGVEKGARVATCVAVRVGDDRRLEILRIVTAFECGAIVNPDGLSNQVEGATVMGLGAALFEAIHFEAGAILNASLANYRVPRITDVPPIEVVLLDRRDLPSAGGGETPIIAIAPALANAVYAATGVRLRTLPLVPDGVIP
jgi:isoquinoline 1-oxidoreductase